LEDDVIITIYDRYYILERIGKNWKELERIRKLHGIEGNLKEDSKKVIEDWVIENQGN
jgi:hypothetical protein